MNINQKAVIGTMVGTDDFDDDENDWIDDNDDSNQWKIFVV